MIIRKKLKIKNSTPFIIALLSVVTMPQIAFAKDDCTEAKQLVKAMTAFFKASPDLKNVIDPQFKLSMSGVNDNPDPSGMLYRHEGNERRFDVDEAGEIIGLEAAVDELSPKGELCLLIDGQTVEDKDESVANVNVLMTFPYKNDTGKFSLSELREGAKDGSKVMKSIAPTGLGFVVPKMKSIILSPAKTGGDVPIMIFVKDGQNIDGPKPQRLGARQYYHLSDIVKTKADEVVITGDYKLDTNFAFKDEDIQEAEKRRFERLDAQKADMSKPSDISAPAKTPLSTQQ